MNKKEREQKERERQYLEVFRRNYQAFPVGEVVSDESPDFIIKGGKKTVGIEVTQIFKDGPEEKKPLQGQESLQRQIIDKAKLKLECNNRGIAKGLVSVHFNTNYKLSNRDIGPLSQVLSDLVIKNFPHHKNGCVLECDVDNYETFPDQFAMIGISRIPKLSKTSWTRTSTSLVHKCTVDCILEKIATKDKKLKEYRTKCDEIWLLIIAEGFAHSSTFEVPEQTADYMYKTEFDCVFLYQIFEGKAWKLNITPASPEQN